MDSLEAGLIGAGIGAVGAVVAAIVGAALASAPAWGLEKRQAKKESRDELRRLLSELVPAATDLAIRWKHRPAQENAEQALALLALRAQIGFVLGGSDDDVSDYIESATALIVTTAPTFSDENRLAVASKFSQTLPAWFRGKVSIEELRKETKSYVEAKAIIQLGKALATLLTNDSSGAQAPSEPVE